jgi:hypothetical protein
MVLFFRRECNKVVRKQRKKYFLPLFFKETHSFRHSLQGKPLLHAWSPWGLTVWASWQAGQVATLALNIVSVQNIVSVLDWRRSTGKRSKVEAPANLFVLFLHKEKIIPLPGFIYDHIPHIGSLYNNWFLNVFIFVTSNNQLS